MKHLARLGLITACLVMTLSAALAQDTNHDFIKWENEISAFERSDATNPPLKGVCVFIGSSTVRFWTNLATDFPEHHVINRGFGGSEIIDSTHFADRVIFPYAPSMVFLRAGNNDLANGKPVAVVFGDFKDFVTKVQGRLPDAEITFIGLSPTLSRWKQHDKEQEFNALVVNYIQGKPHLHYVETYNMVLGPDGLPRADLLRADKLHFNPAGYKLLAARVSEQWPDVPAK